jgi:type VI secretion system protein ImpA
MVRNTLTHFNLDSLLAEISPGAPCGEDISHDIDFMELERLVQGTPKIQLGEHIQESKEPDWEKVYQQSLKLFERSRDLRLIIYLTLSKLCLDGVKGFCDGLALLRGIVERYWEQLFPQLDPDDNNDPTERMNIIGSLSPAPSVMSDHDTIKFIPRLMNLPLCTPADAHLPHPSLKHLLLASGEISVPNTKADDFPSMPLIDAAFDQADIQELQTTNQLLQGCIGHLHALDHLLTAHVGSSMGPDFKKLEQVLKQMQMKTGSYLERKGSSPNELQVFQTNEKKNTHFRDKTTESDESLTDTKKKELSPGELSTQALSGRITSNQDVHKALDMVIAYYEQNEPSSPVPLLLKRAKRLVGLNFVDIIRNLSPDAMAQVQVLSGEEESNEN